jgi:hypothetical protein
VHGRPVAPHDQTRHARGVAAGGDGGAQFDHGLFAFTERNAVEPRTIAQHIVRQRGAVLAAGDDQRARETLLDRRHQRALVDPFVREHDREADHVGVGVDARDHLVDADAVGLQRRAGNLVDTVERLAGGVDPLHGPAGGFERRGDVRQAYRRGGLVVDTPTWGDERTTNQTDFHFAI